MAQRMLLVSPDAIQRIHGDQTDMKALDTEMSAILKSKLSDNEKWTKYNQVLQRYLHFASESRKPIELPIDGKPSFKERLMKTVPQLYKRKALALYDILENSGVVSWNDRGVVSLHGNEIKGSHLEELINDVIRYRKTSNPIGWQAFAQIINELNLSKEVVGNTQRYQTGSGIQWDEFTF